VSNVENSQRMAQQMIDDEILARALQESIDDHARRELEAIERSSAEDVSMK